MLIECHHPVVSKRETPIVVPIGNETYTFTFDAKGRRVCEVWIPDHIKSFLAVEAMYREAIEGAAKEITPKPLAAKDNAGKSGDEEIALSRQEIMAALKLRSIPFKATMKTADLFALLNRAAQAA
jgi:hypothetical protein